MMLNWIHTLWDYHYWGHHKLWDSVMSISEADFKRPVAYSVGSVHEQVVHTMWAEALWLSRIQGTSRPLYSSANLPTRKIIREIWDNVEANWRQYLGQLKSEDLQLTFSYTHQSGEKATNVVSEILCHVVNHGTDHRAQILRLIADYGGTTFEQDMFFYYRDRDGIQSR